MLVDLLVDLQYKLMNVLLMRCGYCCTTFCECGVEIGLLVAVVSTLIDSDCSAFYAFLASLQ